MKVIGLCNFKGVSFCLVRFCLVGFCLMCFCHEIILIIFVKHSRPMVHLTFRLVALSTSSWVVDSLFVLVDLFASLIFMPTFLPSQNPATIYQHLHLPHYLLSIPTNISEITKKHTYTKQNENRKQISNRSTIIVNMYAIKRKGTNSC